MANLEVQPGWPAARQLDRDEFASGGPNGNLNEHAKVFLARTEYLQQQKANKSEIVQGVFEFGTYAEFNAAKANLPLNCTVVIGEENNSGTSTWGIGNNIWNGTTLKKSAFDPVEKSKIFLSNNSSAKIVAPAASNINYTTADRKLTFANTIYVLSPTSVQTVVTPQEIVFATNARFRIEFNTSSRTLRAVAYNAAKSDGWLDCGYVTTFENGKIESTDFDFTIDALIKDNAFGSAKIVAPAASNINYTTADRKLTFANTIYVLTDKKSKTLATPQVLDLTFNAIYRIEYNHITGLMRAVISSAAKAEDWLVCGHVTASASGIITNDFYFRVNSVAPANQEIGKIITSTHLTINLSTDTGFLITRANGRIVSSSRTIALPEYSAPLPTTNGLYRVEYNAYANIIEINASTSANKAGNIFFATLIKANTGFTLYGVDIYSINGVQASSVSGTSSNTGVLLGALSTDINFDFVAKILTIADQKVRFLRNGKTTLLSGQTLDISANTGTWHSIVVDLNNNLSLRQATLLNNDGDFVVGQFRFNDQQISGIPYYSIQGKTSREKSNLRTANFLVPFGNVEPNYEQPELPAYNALWSANNDDYNKFYALYDALVAAHPDYVKKTTLGSDALGNPIHQYQFSTPEVLTLNAASTKAKVVLITGIHGGEKAGMYNTYFALKEIIERWQNDDHLSALYWGVNFIVVPVANPSGYNANTRWNHNTVDIARNFAADWSTALENGGSAPFSEAETVILDAVMSNNRDAVYVCSHHNFGDNQSNFIWNASATYFSRALAKNLIIGQTIRAKKRYAWMPQANNYYVGYTDLGQPGGSEGRQAVDKYALNASTFEISSSFAWEAGMPTYSSAVATIGVETFINWLLMNIKYAPQLYNTRINL